jgi:ribosomal protein S18 acetylase RimI-like enzyme
MPTLRIRRLDAGDVPEIRDLWDRAGLFFRPDGRDSVDRLAEELGETDTFVLGAYGDDLLLGVALGTDDGRKGWINRVAVAPEHRRTGVARALIRACEEVFADRGIGLVTCLIEAENKPSLDLFEGEGYEARRDVVYLRKPLAAEDW